MEEDAVDLHDLAFPPPSSSSSAVAAASAAQVAAAASSNPTGTWKPRRGSESSWTGEGGAGGGGEGGRPPQDDAVRKRRKRTKKKRAGGGGRRGGGHGGNDGIGEARGGDGGEDGRGGGRGRGGGDGDGFGMAEGGGDDEDELRIEEQRADGSLRVTRVRTPDERSLAETHKQPRNFNNLLIATENKEFRLLPQAARAFYLSQNDRILAYRDLDVLVSNENHEAEAQAHTEEQTKREKFVVGLTTVANVLLLIGLIIAVIASGSIAIVASVLDSSLDLLSSGIIVLTSWLKRKANRYAYPQGRERIEPVGVLVFSAVMGTASLVLIIEAVQRLLQNPIPRPETGVIPITILGVDIGLKFVLFIVCFIFRKSSSFASVLMQDQRNDVLLNGVALITSILGSLYWPPLDPIGAILISCWTAYNWGSTCIEQVTYLTGKAASPEFLAQLTYVCLNHDDRIEAIDTVRAFHFGIRYLVEIDVVLPPNMLLQEAHDIGEALQLKIERISLVERCFVHLDFETEHNPLSEHKQFQY